ncbi:MAG: serine hydrolase [Alphaproteobacteria bacterium]|nr:serine hydrolase [Alphaproteobacteria bacterium]
MIARRFPSPAARRAGSRRASAAALALAVVLAAAGPLAPGPVRAQAASPVTAASPVGQDAAGALARLFAAATFDAAWFTPALLAELPVKRLAGQRDELVAQYGAFRRAERDGDKWTVVLARARVPTRIAFDPRGRVRSLNFERPIPIPESLAKAVAAFDALPAARTLLILDDGRERAAREPDRPLGVGSAVKMLVLREYAAAIAAGRLRADQVVGLEPGWKAPGSGMIGTWADGTPVALGTLATMMISISDNTATDALMHVIGRRALDAAAPPRNRPLMTTRELHLLRLHRDPEALARWRSGDVAAREAVLAALPEGRALAPVWGEILASDVDYLFTARELCALAAAVGERPEMRANPGPAASLGWSWAAYKGGSTDTSINATLLLGKDARQVCVAATWNVSPHIDRARFMAVVRGLLGALAAE